MIAGAANRVAAAWQENQAVFSFSGGLPHPAIATKIEGKPSSGVNLHGVSNSKVLVQLYVKGVILFWQMPIKVLGQ